uniref:Bone marrow stromal antigen 2 n=1 Tax=Myotis lucifugus TaxID=59463 RepID=G1Q683_MYOLU
MAPTSHRYSRLPTDENPNKLEDRKLPVWVWILLGLLVVGLFVAAVVLAAKANRPACKDCLPAEQECRNITHLLEQELTQAQEVLRRTEAQAATCKQTVETLKISLKEEKAAGHKQQELVQKLQEEIKTLNQSLRDKSAELEEKSADNIFLKWRKTCKGRFPPHVPSTLQSRLQTQLKTLKTEMDEAKAQGTQMGAENGALTGVLGRTGAER